MKVGTLNHLKTKRLKRRLNIPLYQTVGLLETLWQITTESADAGDIGRFSDEDIALALEWEGDPGELVAAMVETGWLDHDPVHRLVVHDWLDHAPEFIKERVRKRDQRGRRRKPEDSVTPCPGASGQDRTKAGQVGTEAGRVPTLSQVVPGSSDSVPSIPCHTIPCHAIPNPSHSNPTKPCTGKQPDGVSKKFSLRKNTTAAELKTPQGAQEVFERAVAGKICTPDERQHVFCLILAIAESKSTTNLPGAVTKALRGEAGKDPWRTRGAGFEEQAREWIRALDVPAEMQQRTSDLGTGPPDEDAAERKRREFLKRYPNAGKKP